MERRNFVRTGFAWMAAPAALPLLPERYSLYPLLAQPLEGELRLNANENPLGISPRARQAATDAFDVGNRYPGGSVTLPLREALGRLHGVDANGIILGAGSTESIQVSIQSLAAPGYTVISAEPTFDDVSRYAGPSDIEVVTTALTADHQHDLTAMEEAARRVRGPALVYICNPNNPTATVTSCDDVEALINALPDNVHFCVDEAYFEYVESPGYRSFDRMVSQNPNVVVLRTFSKVHGMAGMRLGYAIAHPEASQRFWDFAADNNANQLALAAASASLEDEGHIRRSLESNRRAKAVILEALAHLEIDHLPTETNFLMHRIRGDLQTYSDRMREAGFLVGRPFPPLLEYNRLSIATPDDMSRLAQVMVDFRSRGWL